MKRFCLGLALSLLLAPALIGVAPSWDEIDWFEDAGGYAAAVAEAERSGAPVLVYFYTHWCPYCRQLNKELLGDPVVQAQVSQMLAVRVNAEAGPGEQSLAGHYQVRGYPALFVYSSSQGGRFAPVRRTVSDGSGATRIKTAEEFVESLRTAVR